MQDPNTHSQSTISNADIAELQCRPTANGNECLAQNDGNDETCILRETGEQNPANVDGQSGRQHAKAPSPNVPDTSVLVSSLPPLSGEWAFVGDFHGDLESLPVLGCPVVQVGDLGIGFVRPHEDAKWVASRDDFWFIRGNHDNPDLCRQHPRYLGDWGSHQFMFWVSGAWSIDQNFRTEGVSWWRDEELSYADGQKALADYIAAKPRLVISHDGPSSLFVEDGPMELWQFRPSTTATLLQAMYEAHQPEAWLFGHHHERKDFTLGMTRFRCLNICETLTLTFTADGAIEWPKEGGA